MENNTHIVAGLSQQDPCRAIMQNSDRGRIGHPSYAAGSRTGDFTPTIRSPFCYHSVAGLFLMSGLLS